MANNPEQQPNTGDSDDLQIRLGGHWHPQRVAADPYEGVVDTSDWRVHTMGYNETEGKFMIRSYSYITNAEFADFLNHPQIPDLMRGALRVQDLLVGLRLVSGKELPGKEEIEEWTECWEEHKAALGSAGDIQKGATYPNF